MFVLDSLRKKWSHVPQDPGQRSEYVLYMCLASAYEIALHLRDATSNVRIIIIIVIHLM